jgi:hypothetical protein
LSAPRRRAWAAGLFAFALAAGISAQRPGLRLVDFLGFSTRAQGLWTGTGFIHPQYPVGYPAVLALLQGAGLEPLAAGRLISAFAAGLAAGAAARWLGPGAAALLVAQPLFLQSAATEGTDLIAFALSLAALAQPRPAATGALLAAAALTRQTALLALPAALIGARRRGPLLLAFAIGTSPHWALALALGQPVWPDQSYNLAIGQGAPTDLRAALAAWPASAARGLVPWLREPGVAVGLLALAAALLRRDRRAAALLSWSALHAGAVALAFTNARLLLPSLLVCALGPALALPRAGPLWVGVGAAGLAAALPGAATPTAQDLRLQEIVAAASALPGPLVASDPWVHRRLPGRLEPALPIRELADADPRALRPDALRQRAAARGLRLLVLDPARVERTYPGLQPLLDAPSGTPGLRPAGSAGGARLWEIAPL